VTQNGTILEIAYGSGTNYLQYAALHLESSYFRMNYGSGSGWGTSVVLLPSFWSGGSYYQGCPITTTLTNQGVNQIISFTGTISSLNVQGQISLSPPAPNLFSAEVIINVTGSVVLDNRPGEAFKPLMLSSMHISEDSWDTQSAFVNTQIYSIPGNSWIIQPPASNSIFGLNGGTSSWKANAPTVKITLDQARQITGWVTSSTDPNDDNVGFWAASDQVLQTWQYTIQVTP
jgi:hypothetical protein